MVSLNALIESENIRHQVALAGYSNEAVSKIIAVLNRSDATLFAELTTALQNASASAFSIERLESLLSSVRSANAAAYQQTGQAMLDELFAFADYEAGYQSQVLRAAMPLVVQVAAVSVDQVYAAAIARPFQGVLLRDVLKDMESARIKKIKQAVAQGFVEGRTTDQIIRQLRGTRANKYADGLMQGSRRDIEAVARTTLSHLAGTVQDAVAEKNSDLIKAVRWTSTLDLRTSEICRPRSGKLYTPVTHKPIGHSMPWLSGAGRAHWQCRSTQTWVLKSYKELGIDAPEVNFMGTRASMDGQVPADTTYAQWLTAQSAARQDEVLGPTRGKLLRSGGLTMEQLYSQKGVFLTLDELRQRDAAAFKRAGL